MAIQFRKAEKKAALLRMGVSGPAGAGKTMTALIIASMLAESDPGKILMIDTQRGQGDHYGNQFDFDIYPMADHHPERFMEAMKEAVKAGYRYIILDSVTHEWTGNNGCLEWHDEVARRTKNTFTAWKEVTPVHNKFFDTINSIQAHVIGTLRSKMDHVQDVDDSGKKVVKKMGIGTIQREGSDYEFDVLMEMDIDHCGVITKSRDGNSGAKLDGRAFKKPGREFVEELKKWMADESRHGMVVLPRGGLSATSPTFIVPTADAETIREIEKLWPIAGRKLGDGIQPLAAFLPEHKQVNTLAELPQETATAMLDWLKGRVPADVVPDESDVDDIDPRAELRAAIELLCEKATTVGITQREQTKMARGVAVMQMTTEQLTAYRVALASALNEAGEKKAVA